MWGVCGWRKRKEIVEIKRYSTDSSSALYADNACYLSLSLSLSPADKVFWFYFGRYIHAWYLYYYDIAAKCGESLPFLFLVGAHTVL